MSNNGSSGDMIQSPLPKQKVQLPVPKDQSTPIAEGKKKAMDTESNLGNDAGLSFLNNRLADIIDRNATMVDENRKLKDEVNAIGIAKTQELDKIKKMYDDELSEARRLLDNAAQNQAKSDLENKNLKDSNAELKEKATTLKLSEKEARSLAEELQSQVDTLGNEAQTMRRKTQDMENQKGQLVMQLTAAQSDADKFKKQCDDQQMTIAARDNKIQSNEEKHLMEVRVLKEQLEAAKKDQAAALQKSLNQQSMHNATMSNAIDDIRAEHEENLKDREAQIKAEQSKKMKGLETQIQSLKRQLGEKRDEASKHKALHDQAKQNAERLERELQKAKTRAMNLQADVASQKAMAEEKIKELEESAAKADEKALQLELKMKSGKSQYDALLKEVETYRSLLEIEESRLNITPSPIGAKKSRKRPRGQSTTTNQSPKKSKSAETSQTSDIEVADLGANTDGQDGDASCALM